MLFETTRLKIRSPLLKDGNEIFEAYTQDPLVTKYLAWRPHWDVADSIEWIRHCIETAETEFSIKCVIELKESGMAIGMIDFRLDKFKAEFGNVLARRYWNLGIMTEAMAPLFNHVFDNSDIYRIQALHDLENCASGRVMEKLGMRLEGVLKRYSILPNISDIPRDMRLYSRTK